MEAEFCIEESGSVCWDATETFKFPLLFGWVRPEFWSGLSGGHVRVCFDGLNGVDFGTWEAKVF